ncbi:uncharacterized protein [Physcomitrium patens]|uniref:EF-hand domain-containing protein n=1 Tax=Physcomitrium patens TaxID=3218 RepID=A9U4U2_PHYPA|nr:uncharacterized protein LOC112273614 [Physcomitrium patens]XP_024358335.1 uncharacterized protein LOC112273614 [Physcomitrium patens]PNR33022.1 hypothetical protein PHYPA_024965 [Physcomitrium patens]|eukprot:XP_024358334.1 uncharacterized protein LOC112273614 [Physcomitrella patens]
MSTEGGLHVLDGSQIRNALPDLQSRNSFSKNDEGSKGYLTPSEMRQAAEAEAAALLLGVQLSSKIFENAASKLPTEDSAEITEDVFSSTLQSYLTAIADALEDEPVVVSVLDGSAIKALLEDEDDFAMVAEDLFEKLDTDESGKLSSKELRPAIMQLGVEQGVPPAAATTEAEELVTKLINKYGQGTEELGQAQFAALLQDVLQDMAESLAEKPITIVRDVKMLNGSHLRKMLADEKAFKEMADNMFNDLDVNKDQRLSKAEIRPLFEQQTAAWGLPPVGDSDTEELFDEVFKAVDSDKSGEVEKPEFAVLVKTLLADFAETLRLNPILVEIETASR